MKNIYLIFLSFLLTTSVLAQNVVMGTVIDGSNGETIIGAIVSVKGTIEGVVTDQNGAFRLETEIPYPFILKVKMPGFEVWEIEVTEDEQTFLVSLGGDFSILGDEVVVTASRVEEQYMDSPVTIHKLKLKDIANHPSGEVYQSLSSLQGVQVNQSSLSFKSVNTRGFADAQNWRFIHLLDETELNAPGLNYSISSVAIHSDLDIRSLEVVPGASSALFGPNAFNGVLNIQSKSPFSYPGLSASVKTGFTVQDATGTNPLVEANIRWAQHINDKFAYKINASFLTATDWGANDESYHITNNLVSQKETLLALPRTHPNFNAVNIYGDEVQVPVNLGGDTALINRSGIAEKDIIDYKINNYNINGTLEYKWNDETTISYFGQFSQTDAILRHTTIYPFDNIQYQLHRLRLEGESFDIKTYYSLENANDSYAMLGTGSFIQEGLKSSGLWGQEYGAAFRGEIAEVTPGDHQAARQYADRDIPGAASPVFQQLLENTRNNSDLTTGGSKFVDNTSMVHADFKYNFNKWINFADILLGGSFRRYNLDSEGQLFNDGPNGFNAPIGINEYGGFLQAGKKLMNEHFHLRASIRYDKNENYEGQFSPRASMTIAAGQKKQHRIRLSYQTGFRNPASQESFIALSLGGFPSTYLLGGTQKNIQNFSVNGPAGIVPGETLFNNLVTVGSFLQFSQTGNPADLVPAQLNYLQPEKITSYELGYKARLTDGFLLDMHGHYSQYENFVTRINTFSPEAQSIFSIYTNISDIITAYGGSIGIQYQKNGYNLGLNYSYLEAEVADATQNNPGFLPSFNTPRHRLNILTGNNNLWKNLGYSVQYSWSDAYTWQSPFGEGEISSFDVLDAALLYRIPSWGSTLKIGGSNLLNKEYKMIYGGPNIGSIYYIQFTYDDFLRDGSKE